VTGPSKASPAGIIAALILTAVAALLWAQTVAILADLSGGDAAGRGMAQGFAAIGIILVWLLLCALALIAYAKGEMPRWTAIAALVLIPASGGASMGTRRSPSRRLPRRSLSRSAIGRSCRRCAGASRAMSPAARYGAWC
jgi:hypothetical protein